MRDTDSSVSAPPSSPANRAEPSAPRAGEQRVCEGLSADLYAALLFAGDANLMAVLERTEPRPGEVVYLLKAAPDGRALLRARFDPALPADTAQPISLHLRVNSGETEGDRAAQGDMLRDMAERLRELRERADAERAR